MAGAPKELNAFLLEEAHAEGFPLAGAVDIDAAFEAGYLDHVARYDRWLERGSQGAMEYLKRGRDRRADPRAVFPGAKSVFSVALPYPRRAAGAPDPASGPRYARYLQGPDYHVEVAAMLERVMERVAARLGEPLSWKVCVDTSAVLERTWAVLAGMGWIGKNTMLIHPKLGSYLFLGEVLIDRETGQAPRPLPDYCGHCERCLRACPTGALVGPRDLESRQCISYLTLEKRGEMELPPLERGALGSWVAGCDICNEVCPYNLKAVRAEEAQPAPVLEHDVTLARDWLTLLDETEEQYRARVKGSAMSRIKPSQWRRNLARGIANVADALAPETRVAALVRVEARLTEETDEPARAEWARCRDALVRGSVTLRPAAQADIEWINQKYDEIGFRRSDLSTDYVVIAEMGGKPSGLGRLVRIDESEAELGGIHVFEEYRGRGLAKKIVNHLMDRRAPYSRLYCLPFEKLVSFYKSFGFREPQIHETALIAPVIQSKLAWCNEGSRYPDAVVLLVI